MRQLIYKLEVYMARVYSLGSKQHTVMLGDFKSYYEVTGKENA